MSNSRIIGSGKLEGGKWDDVNAAGSIHILADVEVNTLKVSGSCISDGNIKGNEIKSAGSLKVNGNLSFNELKAAGSINIEGDITGEIVKLAGYAKVAGNINADKFSAALTQGTFNGIYGDSIIINQECKETYNTTINCNEMEATTIQINNCVVQRVSGNDVTIGPDCTIDVVEYSKKILISRQAKIGTIIKI